MEEHGKTERQERRAKRSTRIGIIVIIALIVLAAAIAWGIRSWSEDDQEGPSVERQSEFVLASWDYLSA